MEQAVSNNAIGGHLDRLVGDYQILSKMRPLLAKNKSQAVRYEIEDIFLRFWFAYSDKYRPLIELGNYPVLTKLVKTATPTILG
ncbi:MAG: hypothetical protein FWF71_02855 [Actinomycetia bacterium]|nr:hypothetical protein [Actinomycetes bacterium]